MSDTGISLWMPQPLPLGSLVHITVTKPRLTGLAVVRHCSRKGLVYLVGLEFLDRPVLVNWLGR